MLVVEPEFLSFCISFNFNRLSELFCDCVTVCSGGNPALRANTSNLWRAYKYLLYAAVVSITCC